MAVDYRVSGDAFIEAPHDFRPETMDREYRYEQQRTRKVAWNVATRCFMRQIPVLEAFRFLRMMANHMTGGRLGWKISSEPKSALPKRFQLSISCHT
jgi:hypothetical protein